MTKRATFLKEVEDYTKALAHFMYKYSLPEDWFTKPDHLAIKAKDSATYEAHVEYWRQLAVKNRVSEIKLNGRRLGSVKLEEPLSVGPFGIVTWLELMEPRPEMVGKDKVGLDHMEFYFPDFDEVIKFMENIEPMAELQENPGHKWVSITLNDGREVKLNNRRLAKVVSEEIKTGKTYWV